MGDDIKIIAGRKCLKCNLSAEYYSNNPKQAVYCKNCFMTMILHKFSYTLGKNRVFKDGKSKKVIILYKKDHVGADYLLQIVKEETSPGSKPQLPAEPEILVILESTKLDELKKEYSDAKKKQKSMETSWNWHFVHFSEIFNQEITFLDESLKLDDGKVKIVKYLFGKSTAKSDRLELKRLLIDLLVYRISRMLSIDKVMVPETADLTAQNCFNALCFGRGSSICQLTSGVDSRFPNLTIVRPLREIFEADLRIIMKLKNPINEELENLAINQVEIKTKQTIQDFNLQELARLQNNGFPSTFTNVIQTASKVTPPINPDAKNMCCLCFSTSENENFCGSCERLMDAIPNFPNEIKNAFVILGN